MFDFHKKKNNQQPHLHIQAGNLIITSLPLYQILQLTVIPKLFYVVVATYFYQLHAASFLPLFHTVLLICGCNIHKNFTRNCNKGKAL